MNLTSNGQPRLTLVVAFISYTRYMMLYWSGRALSRPDESSMDETWSPHGTRRRQPQVSNDWICLGSRGKQCTSGSAAGCTRAAAACCMGAIQGLCTYCLWCGLLYWYACCTAPLLAWPLLHLLHAGARWWGRGVMHVYGMSASCVRPACVSVLTVSYPLRTEPNRTVPGGPRPVPCAWV